MRTIRASDIVTYLYCRRAWWYQKRGVHSENLPEMVMGSELHHQHSRAVIRLGCLQTIAYVLILLALALVAAHFTLQFF